MVQIMICNKEINILKWLAEKGILPDIEGANNACRSGNLDIIEWLLGKGILPNADGANWICYNDENIDILNLVREQKYITK